MSEQYQIFFFLLISAVQR